MKFVSVRDFRGRSGQIWRKLKETREIVITLNGKPVALMSAISDETLEEVVTALRRARAMAAVESMQSRSLQKGHDRMPLDEVNAEIASVRKARRRRVTS